MIPHLSRSSLHRCFKRHGISRLSETGGDKPTRKRFKSYPIGFFDLGMAEVKTAQGKLHFFVAIERASKFAFAQLHEHATQHIAADFLRAIVKAVPYHVHTVLTDIGFQCTTSNSVASAGPLGRKAMERDELLQADTFELVCVENGIEHRPAKPHHPWTIGQVERMNRTLEATVGRYHYGSHDELRSHLALFLDSYNYVCRLKTLKGLTPYGAICRSWTTEPGRFTADPHHGMLGLNRHHGQQSTSPMVGGLCPPINTPEAKAPPNFDTIVWEFDSAAWERIQDRAKQRVEGDPSKVWHLIDQALLFTSMEQQRQSLQLPKKVRGDEKQFLATIDSLMDQLGITTSPSSTEGLTVGAMSFSWLMQGAMRKLHPTGPQLAENKRRDRVSVHESMRRLRENYDGVQDDAQEQVLALLDQMGPQLRLLREFTAISLAATAEAQVRGAGLDLTRSTFVDCTAVAYEAAYRRPANPGCNDANGEPGPAVRFIAAVAQEARKAHSIKQHYSVLLKLGLSMSQNTIHRLLGKRLAR